MKTCPKYLQSIALLLCLLLAPLCAFAQDGAPPRHETPASRAVWKQLICLCPDCNKQALDQCASSCAIGQKMRNEASGMLEQGKSSDQILKSFRAEYGDVVLGNPPAEGFGVLAKWVPLGVIALSALPLWLFTRSRRTPRETKARRTAPQVSAVDDARLDAALRDFDY